jgi:hypothetical protein
VRTAVETTSGSPSPSTSASTASRGPSMPVAIVCCVQALPFPAVFSYQRVRSKSTIVATRSTSPSRSTSPCATDAKIPVVVATVWDVQELPAPPTFSCHTTPNRPAEAKSRSPSRSRSPGAVRIGRLGVPTTAAGPNGTSAAGALPADASRSDRLNTPERTRSRGEKRTRRVIDDLPLPRVDLRVKRYSIFVRPPPVRRP